MTNSIDIKFAQKLRGLRLGKDLKQSEAASMLELANQQAYSKLENGQSHFTDEIIMKICEVFEISPEDFTNTAQSVSINHSPQANTQNSFNNDISILNQLIKSKDDIIKSKDELISILKKEIEKLKSAKK